LAAPPAFMNSDNGVISGVKPALRKRFCKFSDAPLTREGNDRLKDKLIQVGAKLKTDAWY
jgi:hypothetical protein